MFSRSFVLIACLCVTACQVFGPEENGRLEIHLQSSFDSTPVQISLDSEVIFDSLATTNHIVGAAEGVVVETSVGSHTLNLLIDGEYEHTQQIYLGEVLYVGVQYFPEGEITIQVNNEGFVYY